MKKIKIEVSYQNFDPELSLNLQPAVEEWVHRLPLGSRNEVKNIYAVEQNIDDPPLVITNSSDNHGWLLGPDSIQSMLKPKTLYLVFDVDPDAYYNSRYIQIKGFFFSAASWPRLISMDTIALDVEKQKESFTVEDHISDVTRWIFGSCSHDLIYQSIFTTKEL